MKLPVQRLVQWITLQLNDSKQPVESISIYVTLAISIALTVFFVAQDVALDTPVQPRSIAGTLCVAYLLTAQWLLKSGHYTLARWLIIALLACILQVTLVLWSAYSALTVLTLGLLIILPGVFFGSRYMPYVAFFIITTLIITPLLHTNEPARQPLDSITSYTIPLVAIFTVAWLSIRRTERTLKRARAAEKRLRTQKLKLKAQLLQESARLKSQQLKEIEQLYSFAILGQNTVATLHELSNHLTVLGMDIDGLAETNEHTDALNSAKESLMQINTMIRAIREEIDTYTEESLFSPYIILRQVVTGLSSKTDTLRLKRVAPQDRSLVVMGDPGALTHVITILIKNSIEACLNTPNPSIIVRLHQTPANIRIVVSDNGNGIPESVLTTLFTPLKSTKPTGLGAGLYIARNLVRTQLHGSLHLISNGRENPEKGYLAGATFALDIPLSNVNLQYPRSTKASRHTAQ